MLNASTTIAVRVGGAVPCGQRVSRSHDEVVVLHGSPAILALPGTGDSGGGRVQQGHAPSPAHPELGHSVHGSDDVFSDLQMFACSAEEAADFWFPRRRGGWVNATVGYAVSAGCRLIRTGGVGTSWTVTATSATCSALTSITGWLNPAAATGAVETAR